MELQSISPAGSPLFNPESSLKALWVLVPTPSYISTLKTDTQCTDRDTSGPNETTIFQLHLLPPQALFRHSCPSYYNGGHHHHPSTPDDLIPRALTPQPTALSAGISIIPTITLATKATTSPPSTADVSTPSASSTNTLTTTVSATSSANSVLTCRRYDRTFVSRSPLKRALQPMASTSAGAGDVPEQAPVCIVVLGMAGSGKTTFVKMLVQHLSSTGPAPYAINLDPAVYHIPYHANIDIRDTVKFKEVMKQYGFGPNGAILTSLNFFTAHFDKVINLIGKNSSKVRHVVIDTPGQIEVFTWSASGVIITELLSSTYPTIIVYVMDTPRSHNPVTFMSNMLYACSEKPHEVEEDIDDEEFQKSCRVAAQPPDPGR
nr:unnamed protein product [Spirometra erinaceieuropaei]